MTSASPFGAPKKQVSVRDPAIRIYGIDHKDSQVSFRDEGGQNFATRGGSNFVMKGSKFRDEGGPKLPTLSLKS